MREIEILFSNSIEGESDIRDLEGEVNGRLGRLAAQDDPKTKLTWFMNGGRMYCVVEWEW
jgi:hypothetical protein